MHQRRVKFYYVPRTSKVDRANAISQYATSKLTMRQPARSVHSLCAHHGWSSELLASSGCSRVGAALVAVSIYARLEALTAIVQTGVDLRSIGMAWLDERVCRGIARVCCHACPRNCGVVGVPGVAEKQRRLDFVILCLLVRATMTRGGKNGDTVKGKDSGLKTKARRTYKLYD